MDARPGVHREHLNDPQPEPVEGRTTLPLPRHGEQQNAPSLSLSKAAPYSAAAGSAATRARSRDIRAV